CRPRRLLPVVLGPVLLVAAQGALGAPKSSPGALAAVIGPDAPLVVELSGGGRLVDRALESSLWRRLRATPEVEAALRTKKARRARSGLAMFAGLLERTPEEAVRAVLGREVAAAITPRGEGDATAILAVRFERPADAERLAEVWH